jgi:rod shape-determining protein MreD
VIADAAKAGALLLFAALIQVSIASTLEVAEGHANVVLVLVVSLALLRGPIFGACAGFWAGLVLDVASLGTLGLTSLLLTLVGHFAGRFGEATSRSSAHPPLVAVALATVAFGFASGILNFMLGSTLSASDFFVAVLLPTLALNMLLSYPLYTLSRRVFPVTPRVRREVSPAV